MDDIIKEKIERNYPEIFKHKKFETVFDIIFEKLNMKEIDGSEIQKGMAVIDSNEAAHLTGNIVIALFKLIFSSDPPTGQ